MKRYVLTILAASIVSTVAVGLASTASAMTMDASSVQDTVTSLKARGYTVVVNKVGNAPMDTCSVSAVRPGLSIVRMDSGVPGAGTDHTTTVVSRTVFVDITC